MEERVPCNGYIDKNVCLALVMKVGEKEKGPPLAYFGAFSCLFRVYGVGFLVKSLMEMLVSLIVFDSFLVKGVRRLVVKSLPPNQKG